MLGLEVVIASDVLGNKALFVLTTLGYCGTVALVGWGASRLKQRNPFEFASSLNTAVVPLTLGLLYAVSESTQVTVSATGAVHHYPWLPLWLAIALTAGVAGWLGRAFRHSRGPSDRSDLERRALLLVTAPVGLFLLVAYLPGDLGTINLFEEGQILAGAEIVRDGAFRGATSWSCTACCTTSGPACSAQR